MSQVLEQKTAPIAPPPPMMKVAVAAYSPVNIAMKDIAFGSVSSIYTIRIPYA